MDRLSRQKINKETQALNDTLDQVDLIDIYRTFYPKAAEYTFFSSAHGTFYRINHMLGHKASLSSKKKNKCWRGCEGKGTPTTMVVGMYIGATIMENNMEVPLKTKYRTTI